MNINEDFPPVHIRDHLRILKKRKWTGILFFVLVVGATSLYLLLFSASYRATVVMTLKPPPVSPLTLTGEVSYLEGMDVITRKLYTQTQFEVFKSKKLAGRVMDRLNLWEEFHLGETTRNFYDLWQKKKVTREMALDAFTEHVDVVSPTALSFHIELYVENHDPELAARIANTLVDAYTDLLYEERTETIRKNLTWLKDEFRKLDADVVSAEQNVQKFKKQRDAISVDDKENILLEKLHTLNASLTQTRIARISAENAYVDAKRLEKDPTILQSVPFVLTSNPQIAALTTQYNSLNTQISGLKTRYKEKHPQMVTLTTTLAEVKENIRREVQKALNSLKANYDYTKLQEESIQKELEAIQAKVIGIDKERIEYLSLLDKAKVNRTIYDSLLTRLKETNIIQEFHNPLQNIDIIDSAKAPDSPSGYRKWYLPVGALVGLLLGVFLCYVKDYFDVTLQNERDIFECMKLPVLGVVPFLKDGALGRTLQPEIVDQHTSLSLFMEYFHRIANILHRLAEEKGAKTFLITSTGPQEGKTTLIANLGVVLAQRRLKILLVDADFRKPQLHDMFGTNNETGLSNCAHEDLNPTGVVRETRIPNLYLLSSGTYLTNPPITLQSEEIGRIIHTLKGSFDLVLFDSSCVQEVSDPCSLARWVDAILWVVSSGQTPKEHALWALKSMEHVNKMMIGVLLNRVRFIRGSENYYFRGLKAPTI